MPSKPPPSKARTNGPKTTSEKEQSVAQSVLPMKTTLAKSSAKVQRGGQANISAATRKPKVDISASETQANQPSSTLKKHKKSPVLTPLDILGSGFYVVPLLRQSVLDPSETFVKHFYVKARAQTGETATLLVSNVSVDDTADSIQALFEELSGLKVAAVAMGKDRLCVVTFNGVVDIEQSFLNSLSKEQCLARKATGSSPSVSCIDRWITEYKAVRPDRVMLGREADERMAELDRVEKDEREKANQPQVDADGFTLVAPKKNAVKKPVDVDAPAIKKEDKKLLSSRNKKRLMDENLSFYRFERKRQRQSELMNLKSQLKNDQRRAERIKYELSSSS